MGLLSTIHFLTGMGKMPWSFMSSPLLLSSRFSQIALVLFIGHYLLSLFSFLSLLLSSRASPFGFIFSIPLWIMASKSFSFNSLWGKPFSASSFSYCSFFSCAITTTRTRLSHPRMRDHISTFFVVCYSEWETRVCMNILSCVYKRRPFHTLTSLDLTLTLLWVSASGAVSVRTFSLLRKSDDKGSHRRKLLEAEQHFDKQYEYSFTKSIFIVKLSLLTNK